MYENIKGYIMTSDFRNDNSGFSRWGFAKKDGIDVFIKEFLSPVYPVDTGVLSQETVFSRTIICENFVREKTKLFDALNKCNTGNIVNITDFFRYKAKYYIVTEKVTGLDLDIENIKDMPIEQKHLICKIITHCVNILHQHGIVHGDIKHDNIIFKTTAKGKYIAKIIDFDASFFEDSLPNPDEEFRGDMIYFAPESFLYMAEEVDKINRKIDVFALGLLFHQYFTGKLPDFDSTTYDYAFEAILDNNVLCADETIPDEYAKIINDMLKANPDERPDLSEIFDRFNRIDNLNNPANGSGSSEDKNEHDFVESFGFYIAGDL